MDSWESLPPIGRMIVRSIDESSEFLLSGKVVDAEKVLFIEEGEAPNIYLS